MPDDRQAIEQVVKILDGVKWATQGDHRAKTYLDYIIGQHGDERTVMDRLLGDVLERVLGFTINQDLLT